MTQNSLKIVITIKCVTCCYILFIIKVFFITLPVYTKKILKFTCICILRVGSLPWLCNRFFWSCHNNRRRQRKHFEKFSTVMIFKRILVLSLRVNFFDSKGFGFFSFMQNTFNSSVYCQFRKRFSLRLVKHDVVCVFAAAYNSSVTSSENYTEALSNSSSPEYQAASAAFCADVDASYKNSTLADQYDGCQVTGFQ